MSHSMHHPEQLAARLATQTRAPWEPHTYLQLIDCYRLQTPICVRSGQAGLFEKLQRRRSEAESHAQCGPTRARRATPASTPSPQR
jgi:hypothetical protein